MDTPQSEQRPWALNLHGQWLSQWWESQVWAPIPIAAAAQWKSPPPPALGTQWEGPAQGHNEGALSAPLHLPGLGGASLPPLPPARRKPSRTAPPSPVRLQPQTLTRAPWRGTESSSQHQPEATATDPDLSPLEGDRALQPIRARQSVSLGSTQVLSSHLASAGFQLQCSMSELDMCLNGPYSGLGGPPDG